MDVGPLVTHKQSMQTENYDSSLADKKLSDIDIENGKRSPQFTDQKNRTISKSVVTPTEKRSMISIFTNLYGVFLLFTLCLIVHYIIHFNSSWKNNKMSEKDFIYFSLEGIALFGVIISYVLQLLPLLGNKENAFYAQVISCNLLVYIDINSIQHQSTSLLSLVTILFVLSIHLYNTPAKAVICIVQCAVWIWNAVNNGAIDETIATIVNIICIIYLANTKYHTYGSRQQNKVHDEMKFNPNDIRNSNISSTATSTTRVKVEVVNRDKPLSPINESCGHPSITSNSIRDKLNLSIRIDRDVNITNDDIKQRSEVGVNTDAFDSQEEIEQVKKQARSMIANAAHDLKTPLSSMMQGLEVIEGNIDTSLGRVDYLSSEPEYLQESFEELMKSVREIRNVNLFMMSTINRFQDYAKLGQGLRLVPNLESFDFIEAMSLPIKCLRDSQTRVSIRLLPIAREICQCLITDKQWLQENLLCLLSNAVKYSSGGEVTIQVFLEEIPLRIEQSHSFNNITPTPSMGNLQRKTVAQNRGLLASTLRSESIDSEHSGVSSPRYNKFLRLEVEDHGVGMSVEAMNNLFSPFQQSQRLAGGTGLGLYSMAKRVEALHGDCGVSGRRDKKKGSLFWFRFPYRPDEEMATLNLNRSRKDFVERASAAVSPRNLVISKPINSNTNTNNTSSNTNHTNEEKLCDDTTNNNNNNNNNSLLKCSIMNNSMVATPSGPSLSILLVEDTSIIAKMTSMMLLRMGHRVSLAENGEVALQMMMDRVQTLTEDESDEIEEIMMNSTDCDDATQPPQYQRQKRSKSICKMSEKIAVINAVTNGVDTPTKSTDKEVKVVGYAPGFDLVLMDLQMPILDGLEATRRLRLFERVMGGGVGCAVCHHYVVALSAAEDDDTIEEAFQSGCDDFLAKPMTKESVASVIQNFLSKQDHEEE